MDNDKQTTENDREVAIHFIRTFSDTAREPFLILDPELRVVGANESFYKNFRVTKEETDNKLIYDLGDGQWNIPELRKLLEDIVPKKKVFNDFEVSHEFPKIGLKIMLLNARQLDSTHQILLAIGDITSKRAAEIKLTEYTKRLEKDVIEKAKELMNASVLLAKETKVSAELLAKETKVSAELLAKETKMSAELLEKETKMSAELLEKETKMSAEEIRKSNESYTHWTKWMTIALIIVAIAQMALAIVPLFKGGK
jgi:uncharacterized protein YgiM (DUF1202 family)